MFMQNLTKRHKLPKNVFNRYRTERTFASTHILALKKSRSKAGQSSAYLRFSLALNRHRRGLETCPQANLAKSGHAFFRWSERRVWLSVDSKILASTFGRFRLYRLKMKAICMSKMQKNNRISEYREWKLNDLLIYIFFIFLRKRLNSLAQGTIWVLRVQNAVFVEQIENIILEW